MSNPDFITPAWQEGWDAGMDGLPRNANPYPAGMLEHVDWDEGWWAAEEDEGMCTHERSDE